MTDPTDSTTMATGLDAGAVESFVRDAQLFHLALVALVTRDGGEARLSHADVGAAVGTTVQVTRTDDGLILRATDEGTEGR